MRNSPINRGPLPITNGFITFVTLLHLQLAGAHLVLCSFLRCCCVLTSPIGVMSGVILRSRDFLTDTCATNCIWGYFGSSRTTERFFHVGKVHKCFHQHLFTITLYGVSVGVFVCAQLPCLEPSSN